MRLDVIGLRRAGCSSADRAELKGAFDLVYRSGLPVTRCVEQLERCASAFVREFADFIRVSQRGICKFAREEGPAADPLRAAA